MTDTEAVLVRWGVLWPGGGGQGGGEDWGRAEVEGEGEDQQVHLHTQLLHSQVVTEGWAADCECGHSLPDISILFVTSSHHLGTISINYPNPPSLLEWQYGGIIRLVTWHFALCCFQIEKMFKNSLEEDYRDFCQNSVKEIFVDKEFFVGRLSNISWLQIDLHAKSDICEALLERATIIY